MLEKGDLVLDDNMQFEELQGAYFLRRRQIAFKECQKQQSQESVSKKGAYKDWDTYDDGLDDFQSILTTYTRYRYVCFLWEVNGCDFTLRLCLNSVSELEGSRIVAPPTSLVHVFSFVQERKVSDFVQSVLVQEITVKFKGRALLRLVEYKSLYLVAFKFCFLMSLLSNLTL